MNLTTGSLSRRALPLLVPADQRSWKAMQDFFNETFAK
jgi:hypothetical protein